jgi:hypothetical protein
MTDKRQYRVFLLRLWQADGDDGTQIWRATLEDARTGERRGFADLARLFAFLEEQVGHRSEHDAHPPADKS